MISLIDLSKHFGPAKAVDRINLSVSKGEIFGFIGPNGAGKTTTIQMMAGLLAPTRGSVWIDGVNMANHPEEAKKKIGLIPDRPYLYDKLTGMEFLRFIWDVFDMQKTDFTSRSRHLLEMFSLTDRAHELIESYSHGMKQRLIMAGALLHEPPILIVDEPMVGLDPRGIKMVKELFRKLADGGTTVFMSTHTLALAEDICRRIGIIHQGKLIAVGTVEELKERIQAEQANLEELFFRFTG
jgi:ABC-2 type transport system ATP-binding protein